MCGNAPSHYRADGALDDAVARVRILRLVDVLRVCTTLSIYFESSRAAPTCLYAQRKLVSIYAYEQL